MAALEHREETRALASSFQAKHDALEIATAARVQAEKELTSPRVILRFAEKSLEFTIRQVALLAHTVDNNAPAVPLSVPISEWPECGADARWRGPDGGSSGPARPTEHASRSRTHQGIDLVPLDKELAAFSAAVASRDAADAKVGQTRTAERGARAAFVSAYDSNAGAIRQLFPRSREQQDLFFDEFRSGSRSTEAPDALTPPPVVSSVAKVTSSTT